MLWPDQENLQAASPRLDPSETTQGVHDERTPQSCACPSWLTDLGGDLRVSEKGPAIGIVQWIGAHREVRTFPYRSESQLQLTCDLDPWTLERLEAHRDGEDLALWIELWPRLEHPGGYPSAGQRRETR